MSTIIVTDTLQLQALIREAVRVEMNNCNLSCSKITPNEEAFTQLLTTQEASKFLKLKVQTIYDYVNKVVIPSHKKGKRLYFFKHELIKWIEEGKRKTDVELNADAKSYIAKKSL